MDQVHVASVRVDVVPEVLAALGRAGFTVTVSATPSCGQAARCRRGNRESVISI